MKNSADNPKKTCRDLHRNVMLLAMSTFPTQPRMNTYQDETGQLYLKGLSQLEPHTKYVLNLLAKQKERLDAIVILESAKVREEKPENWGKETATTFFVKRIYQYLGEEEPVDIQVPDPLEELQETVPDQSLYGSREDFPEILTVDLEDPVFFWVAVQKILGSDRRKTVHLYMDMQGGDRNAVSQMNAIAELLIRQNVEIRGRFANDFEPKKAPPLHTIREASREYRTYDLISAMDIFVRYGWGDKLEEYFEKNQGKDTKEKHLTEAIKEASMAISRCNAEGFDHAVRKIERLQEEFENPETITEMDVVYRDIVENYAPLFGAKYRYVAQIRWCLDRNFLQQALTILEAKMPYEFVCSGLIYYQADEKNRERLFRICEKSYRLRDLREHYRMKDLNHYLIKDYCCGDKESQFKDKEGLLIFGLGKARKKEVISLLGVYRKLCRMRNQMNHAAAREYQPGGWHSYMAGKYAEDRNWKEGKENHYEKEIRNFLQRWERLADQVPEAVKSQIVDLG